VASHDRLRNRLKVLRAERDLTQAELARRVGVTRKTINTVENGVFVPSTVLALALARELGVPVEEIFQLDGPGAAVSSARS
jgi:putative transcriptional regulator